MRILVAEDQPELLRMLVKNLTTAGYTVDGVPDGAEALAYLDAAVYDAAVLDIMMPRVDGLTVLRTLRDRGDVAVIHRQAEQMSRLIAQLLHITRLEQGTQKVSFETADLGELAEVVCDRQQLLAPEDTTLTCKAEPLTMSLDVMLITRLLNNLISNAFRYGTPGGHVEVTVKREGTDALLAVRDDGIGIAPEQQAHIWQRFYQVDPARSGSEGTGLGLYMVQQITRLHGGTASVESKLGQGSTFLIRLPIRAS